MWRAILISIFILACQSDKEEETKTQTIIFLLKQQFKIQKSYDSIVTDNVALKERIKIGKANTNAVIEATLGYSEAILEAKYLRMKNVDIEKELKGVVDDNRKLQLKNDNLIRENESYKNKLEVEIVNHSITRKEKNKAQATVDALSKLTINSVNVVGLCTMVNLYLQTKYYECNKESKVKLAKVSFVFPRNPIADREQKTVVVTMFSTDKKDAIEKDTTVNYVGEEMPITLLMKGKMFKVGDHLVSIRINGKLESENIFHITK